MATPVYIVCCENSLEDRGSGLISCINIFEKFQFLRLQQPSATPTILPQMRIIAVWRREAGDENRDHEFEMSFINPGKETPILLHRGNFVFLSPLYRITSHLLGPPPIEGSGILRFRSQVRPVGAEKPWTTQECLIEVEEAPPGTQQTPVLVVPAS
jgi:hypothetical protein